MSMLFSPTPFARPAKPSTPNDERSATSRRPLPTATSAAPSDSWSEALTRDWWQLFLIKVVIALYWGLVDATVFANSGRFATMQTGNFIILGNQLGHGREGGAFTLAVVACTFFASAAFKAGWARFESSRRMVVRAAAVSLVLLAITADVLVEWGPSRSFNLAMAAAGGVLASGYCAVVSHGVEGLPMGQISFLATFLADPKLRTRHDLETATTSLLIVAIYTCGAAGGWMWEHQFRQNKVPIFTIATVIVAPLVLVHYESSIRHVADVMQRSESRRALGDLEAADDSQNGTRVVSPETIAKGKPLASPTR
mmetsp:Transcript_23985/g.72089  ORF Transcript_23985/g.72089 Transcript_23985/m.72089 type:complete len:311 (-) Transcript_23985:25-957(-)